MIAPLLGTSFAGVTWYQGESNAIPGSIAPRYEALHTLWIKNWREKFGRADMPFYFVQLASLAHPDDWDFPLLRDIQRRTLDTLPPTGLPHTGMVVTIDIGDSGDIHPRNKHDVGERLARWALADVYGREDVVKSGPLAALAVRVHMELHGAIVVTFETFGSPLATRDGGEGVVGVELVVDGRGPVTCSVARIESPSSLMAFLPDGVKLADVRAIRYAWSPDPKDANLINEAGLPASPFEVKVE
jgi:sialate O-acetylesterase